MKIFHDNTTLVLILLLPMVMTAKIVCANVNHPETVVAFEQPVLSFNERGCWFNFHVTDPTGVLAVRTYFRFTPDMPFIFVEMSPKEEETYKLSSLHYQNMFLV